MNRRDPFVSIVIGNYNYGRFLGDAIDSALSQDYPNFEVIVVDDGSTDDSRDVTASFRDRVIPIFKSNEGMGSVLNSAFPKSSGDIVLWFDSDDTLYPSAVGSLVEAFGVPDVVQAHGAMRAVDLSGAPLGFSYPTRPFDVGLLRDDTIARGPGIYTSRPGFGAWTRPLLERILPMPAADFAVQADTYLVDHAPLFGRVAATDQPLGTRRIHGGNSFGASSVDVRLRQNLEVFEARIRSLSSTLADLGVDHDPEKWKQDGGVYAWMRDSVLALDEVRRVVPGGATYILVDENHWANPLGGEYVVQGRTTIPFMERDGAYGGHPASDEAAVNELERLRQEGATRIIFGWPAFWWLDHYRGFQRYLDDQFSRIVANERIVAYDIARL